MPSRLARLSLGATLPPPPVLRSVSLRVVEPLEQVLLSGEPAALGAVLGLELPGPGGITGGDPLAIWQAPDRWLLVSEREAALAARLAAALAGRHAAVTDLSHGLALFEIAGAKARDLLRQGTSFDLDGLTVGRSAVTLFADLRATLYPRGPETFYLHAEIASAAYVWDWLTAAASAYA